MWWSVGSPAFIEGRPTRVCSFHVLVAAHSLISALFSEEVMYLKARSFLLSSTSISFH
jgi:hypothetical protein